MEIPGADHFDVVNAKSEAWQKAIIPALVPLACMILMRGRILMWKKLVNSGYKKLSASPPAFFSLSISHVEGTALKRCWIRNLNLHSHVVFQCFSIDESGQEF